MRKICSVNSDGRWNDEFYKLLEEKRLTDVESVFDFEIDAQVLVATVIEEQTRDDKVREQTGENNRNAKFIIYGDVIEADFER